MKKFVIDGVNLLLKSFLWPLCILGLMSQIVVYTRILVPFPEFAGWPRLMHVPIVVCIFFTFIAWMLWQNKFSLKTRRPDKRSAGKTGYRAKDGMKGSRSEIFFKNIITNVLEGAAIPPESPREDDALFSRRPRFCGLRDVN
jgi:hypothetical protein